MITLNEANGWTRLQGFTMPVWRKRVERDGRFVTLEVMQHGVKTFRALVDGFRVGTCRNGDDAARLAETAKAEVI